MLQGSKGIAYTEGGRYNAGSIASSSEQQMVASDGGICQASRTSRSSASVDSTSSSTTSSEDVSPPQLVAKDDPDISVWSFIHANQP